MKKMKGPVQDNIAEFLLHYRTTEQGTTGETPSMLMMKRDIRTRLDIMLPHSGNQVLVEQSKMVEKGKYNNRIFHKGDPVYIINFSKNAKQVKWLEGVITDKIGPLTYIIQLSDGRIFKRHVDHIKERVINEFDKSFDFVTPPNMPAPAVCTSAPLSLPVPVSLPAPPLLSAPMPLSTPVELPDSLLSQQPTDPATPARQASKEATLLQSPKQRETQSTDNADNTRRSSRSTKGQKPARYADN